MISDNYLMPFGKYKDISIGSVPADYLDWLAGQDWLFNYPDVRDYIRENREHIDRELEEKGRV